MIAYQIKITEKNKKPAVWRRCQVPAALTYSRLAEILLAVLEQDQNLPFLNIVVPLAIIYAVCVWGLRLVVFFLPFVIGWIVAMIANPLVRFLERKLKIVRRHGSVILIVGVLGLVIFGFYGLCSWLFQEMTEFVQALPEIYGSVQGEVNQAYARIGGLLKYLPADTENTIGAILENAGGYIGDFVQKIAASAGGRVVRTLPEVFVNAIIICLSSYLFLADHDRIVETVKQFTPEPVLKYGRMVRKDARTLIGGYFLAQFKIMFVIAIVLVIGMLILGVPYGIFLGIGIAILDFLPMFGTGTALIPWAVVKLFTGEYGYAVGLIVLYVLTQGIRQVIQPKIVGDSMGLPPLATLFFLYLGFKFRGIAGMIIAVPIGILFIRFYEYGAFDGLIRNVKLLAEEIRKLMEG